MMGTHTVICCGGFIADKSSDVKNFLDKFNCSGS